jgi:hypothetical protein
MKHVSKLMFGMVMMMLLVGVLVAPAAAAPPDTGTADEVMQERDFTGGKYAYKLMLLRLDALQDIIDNAQAAADLADEFIAEEQTNGYDTAILEAGLSNLRAKLTEAQGHHDTAAAILADHAGFDDDGNVTDPQQARETLKNARKAMRDGMEDLRDGRKDFREAFKEYRQSKQDK